jgi:hypothetical protein
LSHPSHNGVTLGRPRPVRDHDGARLPLHGGSITHRRLHAR